MKLKIIIAIIIALLALGAYVYKTNKVEAVVWEEHYQQIYAIAEQSYIEADNEVKRLQGIIDELVVDKEMYQSQMDFAHKKAKILRGDF